MSLARVGPVEVTHFDPAFSWTSSPTMSGMRAASIGGMAPWWQVQQLAELVDSPERRITIGGHTGILEYIWCDDVLLGPKRGFYLLDSLDESATQADSLNGVDGLAPFSLKGVFLPPRQVRLARSASQRVRSITLEPVTSVAAPFFASDAAYAFAAEPGGTTLVRSYDAAFPHAGFSTATDTRSLALRLGSFISGEDSLPEVVLPAARANGTGVPPWVTKRGSDVRVWDRRALREVPGPGHPFTVTSDVFVTNGLLRFWLGPPGVPPYVNVEGFSAGWHDEGCISFEGQYSTEPLLSARLTAVSPESVSVALSVESLGEVVLTLRRGERGVRIQDGSARAPRLDVRRRLKWRGMPPYIRSDAVVAATGKFNGGVTIADGDITFAWPWSIPRDTWTYAMWWKPEAAQTTQVDSGLLTILDSDSPVGEVSYSNSTKKLTWTQNAQAIDSAALTFAANTPILIALRFSATSGRTLSTVVTGGSVAHVANPAFVSPGTTEDNFRGFAVGVTSTAWFGAGDFGSLPFGTGTQAHGVLDNVMVFEDCITDAEFASLAAATSGLGGLPAPEARLGWYAAFDTTPEPKGSALGTGRRYEATAEGGSTRVTDAYGFTRVVAAFDALTADTGLALSAVSEQLELCAYLARATTNDDIADIHAQMAAECEQSVRLL